MLPANARHLGSFEKVVVFSLSLSLFVLSRNAFSCHFIGFFSVLFFNFFLLLFGNHFFLFIFFFLGRTCFWYFYLLSCTWVLIKGFMFFCLFVFLRFSFHFLFAFICCCYFFLIIFLLLLHLLCISFPWQVNGCDVLGLRITEIAKLVKSSQHQVTLLLWSTNCNTKCNEEVSNETKRVTQTKTKKKPLDCHKKILDFFFSFFFFCWDCKCMVDIS